MSIFELYLKLGFDHIIDIQGYDHILFITALCAVYSITQWQKVLILITAFTLGHSTTLLLAALHIININSTLIEFLIPLTIFITALINISVNEEKFSKKLHALKYGLALFFGMIHGLGFSNYLQSLLGKESNIISPLFAFNLGLELGQIIIIFIFFIFLYLIINLRKASLREWTLVVSGAAIGISTILMIERFPDLL